MWKTLFVVILVQLVFLIFAKKTIKIDEYKVCGRGENCPIKLHNMTLQYTREGGFSFCGEVEYYRDMINDKLEVSFDFQKCASREALDTCEKLSSIKPPSICSGLELQGLGFDEFRNGFEPPFRCPFKKGIYKIKNATVNPELFKLLPLEGHYWKLNASVYENNKYIASICFDFEAKIITHIENAELCYEQKNGPISISNISVFRNKKGNFFVRGIGDFHRDIDSSKLKIAVNMTKCPSRESLDFCEPFISLQPSNVCMFLNLKNVAWEPFVYGFTPPFKCPFKKGIMIANNVTIDGNLFQYFSLLNVYWRMKFIFIENNIRLVDICADIKFLQRN